MTDEPASRPDVLWHYTTTEGLIGIVTNRCIWATDEMYLNDSREILTGADRLAEQADAARTDTPTSKFEQLWLSMLNAFGPAEVRLPEQGPYLSCFCEDGDLLSQWRAYASGLVRQSAF